MRIFENKSGRSAGRGGLATCPHTLGTAAAPKEAARAPQRHSRKEFGHIVRSDGLRGQRATNFLSGKQDRRCEKKRGGKRSGFHSRILPPRTRKYSPIPISNVTRPARACSGLSSAL
jgi:hypothetical protein